MAIEVKVPSPIGVNVTRTELFGIITAGELKPLWYRVSECLEDEDAVVWVVAFRPDNNPLTPCSLSSQAWNETTDKFGSYDIGTSGNNDDTFTAQGGGSGGIAGITPSSGVNIDNTDPDNPQPWINDFNLFLNPSGENNTVEWSLSGAGDISFESAELVSPNNKRMIKFDLATSNGALAEYTVSTNYIGQKMVFKAMIKTDENLDVRIELDDVEVATAEVESSSEWQLVSVSFTPETGFTGNIKVFIENENAAVYFLDMMYVGVDVFQKLPYIPLSGTEAGNPVTGPIELDLTAKIFNTNGIEEAGLGGDIIDGLSALFLYFENLSGGNKRGIGLSNTGVWVADEHGYGLTGTSYFNHDIETSFVQRKYVDDRVERIFVLSSNQSVTSATETNITSFNVPVEANTVYSFKVAMHIGCSGTGGVKFGYKVPTASEIVRLGIGCSSSSTGMIGGGSSFTGDTGLITTTYNVSATASGWVIFDGTLFTDSTSGNFIITFASATAVQTSTIYKGSKLTITKVN